MLWSSEADNYYCNFKFNSVERNKASLSSLIQAEIYWSPEKELIFNHSNFYEMNQTFNIEGDFVGDFNELIVLLHKLVLVVF